MKRVMHGKQTGNRLAGIVCQLHGDGKGAGCRELDFLEDVTGDARGQGQRGVGDAWRRVAGALAKCLRQVLLYPLGQGGREQDGAATKPGLKCEQGFQQAGGIGIVGVDLVGDQYVAAKPEQAQALMLGRQDG